MRRADIAMYVAKRSRAGAALFEPDLEQPTVSRVSLLGEVRSAIEGGHLDLHFQPQVQMPAGQLARAEALVRWRHPQRGLILPGEFIPLVEQSGLMNQLTARVLRDALAYYQQWRAVGLRIPLTVNLSARNLNDPRLADTLAALLREYNVTPMDLTLDISEASLLSEATRALDLLHHVRSLGVRVAVDDFGGNVPALPLLRRLPVDEVKLDHSVVRSMDLAGSTLQDAIAVGHAMGLVVSAEGVEEPRTWRRLSELNCDMAQGYLVSYPLPAANLVEWVRGRQRGWGNELIAYPRK